MGLDLSLYDNAEILALRKLVSNINIRDNELPILFKVFVGLSFIDTLYPEYEGEVHLVDQFKSTGVDIYNTEIEYWESISNDGNVVATHTLANFYRIVQKLPEAEAFYQKLFVNVTNKMQTLQQLINCVGSYDGKRTAAYLWYAEERGIQLPEGTMNPAYLAYKEEYTKEDIKKEMQELKQNIEDLQVNYANAELTDLNDVYHYRT